MVYSDFPIFIASKSGRVASFGESNGARVTDDAVCRSFQSPSMGMSVAKGPTSILPAFFFIADVPVGAA